MNLKELVEARKAKVDEAQAILDKAKSEERETTTEEEALFDGCQTEIRSLNDKIAKAEKHENFAQQRAMLAGMQAGTGVQDLSEKDKKDIRGFSVLKMVRSLVDKTPLDGVEKEMHDEGVREAKELGQEIRGVAIPSRVVSFRDNSVTMPTQPEDGKAVVETNIMANMSMMDMLRDSLVARRLGATYLNDLVGNISFTRMIERPKASWKPEVGALDKSNVKFSSDELAPKRLGTYTIQSLQFLRQTAPAIERKIREEIVYSIQEGVDIAAIKGTGLNNEPTGILNDPDVAAINIPGLGPNGGPLTRGKLIALRTALLKRNLRGTNLAWLMNADIEGYLSDTPIATNSDKFILETDRLLGYPYVMSNMVPSDITKGTSSDLSAIIYGDWRELYIAQWGGIDLLADPYTLAVDGQVKIVAQGFFNVLIHRPEAFAYYKDVQTVEAP